MDMQNIRNWPQKGLTIALATAVAMMGLLFLVPKSEAHQDPATCTDNGLGMSLSVFRNNEATVIGGADTVTPGEVIKYRTTLSALGLPSCNFSLGTLTITTPDGVTDVTPGGGIPLVSVGTPFVSAFVSYTVDSADVGGDGDIDASTNYSGGQSHIGDNHDTASGSQTKQTLFVKLDPQIATNIHNNGDHTTDIQSTTVAAGTSVHDKVTVTGTAEGGTPTGTVDFKRYSTIGCTGDSIDENDVALSGGTAESSAFVTVAGFLSYKVHYDGDDNYNSADDDACEPLTAVESKIIIQKETNPEENPNTTQFEFDPSYASNFFLADDGSNNSGNLAPNTYTVAEIVPAGWTLTDITCTDPDQQSSDIGNTATIDLDLGETVTCVFTNTQKAHIIVVKDAVSNNIQDFEFNPSWDEVNFFLDDDGNNANTLSNTKDSEVLPGSGYSVAEVNIPAGWMLDSATCDGTGNTPQSITVGPGETVTCTFVNKELAKIILVKNTLGGDGTFDFDVGNLQPDPTQITTVGGTGNHEYPDLDPDLIYSIAETPVPAGWDLISSSCNNGDPINQIEPNTGEVITCTFVNEKDASITIVKETDPDGGQDFDFTGDLGAFMLDDDQSNPNPDLTPGLYDVDESAETGWDLTNIVCQGDVDVLIGSDSDFDPGDTGVDIDLDPGENVTCTFTNTQRGTIIVEKQTNPDAAAGSFTFTGNAAGVIADNGQIVVNNLVPGTYTSTETDPLPNFALTGIVCDDGASATPSTFVLGTRTATFKLDPGETVKCTFTNTLQQKESLTDTHVHKPPHDDITGSQVPLGTTVHDLATVTGDGVIVPTGNVSFDLYASDSCTGQPIIPTEILALNLGSIESTPVPNLPVGSYGYLVNYSGDSNYFGSPAQCEPFAIVDARITISLSGANEVNDAHTFTVFVEKNDGTGWVDAAGVTINSTESGVGAITGGTCGPSGPTDLNGECTVIVNSASAGVSTVQASGTVSIGAANVDVATNGHGMHDISNQKTWVDANITISPDGTNPVNALHTFTVTVMKDNGSGMVPAANEDVDFTLTDGGGAVAVVDNVLSTCDDPGANTNGAGQCTIVFTSAMAGTTVGNASVTLIVGSVSLTRDTDPSTASIPAGPNGSGPATKTWEQPALEGCTPGYWKQSQHFGNWTSPYVPGDQFSAFFENAFPGKTLLQVLSQGGGGLNALGRHTVAALLNGASGGVDYAFTDAQVIAMFNAAFPGGDYETLKNQLAAENEKGCPLGRAELPLGGGDLNVEADKPKKN